MGRGRSRAPFPFHHHARPPEKIRRDPGREAAGPSRCGRASAIRGAVWNYKVFTTIARVTSAHHNSRSRER